MITRLQRYTELLRLALQSLLAGAIIIPLLHYGLPMAERS